MKKTHNLKKIFSFYIDIGLLKKLKKISIITDVSVSSYIRRGIKNIIEIEEKRLKDLLSAFETEEENSVSQ